MKSFLKKFAPPGLVLLYHKVFAWFGAFIYRFPAKKMIIIGITGTKGKTSAANYIFSCLKAGGYKVGLTSTAGFKIGDKEFLNNYHMTMPGRFVIQKLLRKMLNAGCKFCIVETTSEGLKQWRHTGIYYDIAIFTNLTPEHLPSHGGKFEEYKKAKGKMFASLFNGGHKQVDGKKIEKVIIANSDSEHSDYFLSFPADKKITFGLKNLKADFLAGDVKAEGWGINFAVKGERFELAFPGVFNIYNALPGIIVSSIFSIPADSVKKGLKSLSFIPGRMEKIEEGQNFTLVVDYAHEKQSMGHLLNTAKQVSRGKVIVLLGAEGGGRDKNKRPEMGELAGRIADYVVVSNVDPYEDDPKEIIEDIAKSAEKFGKVRGTNLFTIEDRRQGIKKALSLAEHGDIVLITGKGAEQSMILKGRTIPWDDRKVVREEIKKFLEIRN
ncbi:MAG: UDP-N-acetylmuramyl-tripeptide synthetase [Candidatus Paceibacterota bacterium]|jgi:UDP-N-acetylmuramoyl-L-alanyl-D-glutamate--2,6-diaminopimelate ligase